MYKLYSLSVFGVLLATFGGVVSHSYHFGACPAVEPMPGFEMEKMLGLWYAIEKTSTASSCITYNFTKTDEPNKYRLEQVSQHFALGLTPLKHDYRYTGTLTVPDLGVPAKMIAKFPLNFIGGANYIVMATDYTNYSAVFTCQKLAFAHRRSATILSREKSLSRMYIDKLHNKLSSYGIAPYDLSIISQTDCPKHFNGTVNGVNIAIDDKTFSAHNIKEVAVKTGGAIADGVEYAVDAGKKVYRKFRPSNGSLSSKEELTETPASVIGIERDAEWLP